MNIHAIFSTIDITLEFVKYCGHCYKAIHYTVMHYTVMQDLEFGTGNTQSMEISGCFRYLIYSTFGLSTTVHDNTHSGLSILLEEDFEYGKCGGIVDMDNYQINNKFFCKLRAWNTENWRNISQFLFFQCRCSLG